MSNNKENKEFKSKATKLGSYSAFLTLVVIAIVIVVNLMVGELPATVTKFDTSSLKLYTLTDSTVQLLKGLNDDITMYYIAQNGTEDVNIEEMLERYSSYTSRITVKTVDPTAHPGFSSKYTDESLSNNSVIVESAKRSSVIPYENIYTTEYSDEDLYNYYMTGQMPKGTSYFNGEGQLTTAIDYVTSDNLPVLYIVTGHGETSLSKALLNDAKAENILTEELSLLTVTSIPENAGTVILNAPTSDISEQEKNILLDYMDKGGKVLLTTIVDSYSPEAMPNLSALTDAYGLHGEEGLVIEGDKKLFMQLPFILLPKLNKEAELAQNLTSANITTILPMAHAITKNADTDKYVDVLLSTSDQAYIKADYATAESLDKADGDKSGTFYVGASAENLTSGGKLVWFTSPLLLSEEYYTYNGELFMSVLTTLCEKESSLSILGKALQVQSLVVSSAAAAFWGTILILVLPLGCIILGLVIWNKRRKR